MKGLNRPPFNSGSTILVLMLLFLLSGTAFGQMLVETGNNFPLSAAAMTSEVPRQVYNVKSVEVEAKINDQSAETLVRQTIHNPSRRTLEVELFFPLPPDAAIQSLTLLVNGTEIPGRLLTREEARRIYEGIVRRKQDPALMEYIGYGLFKTSVFPVPPGEDRTLIMKYTQLLPRKSDVIEYTYPFGTQKFSGTTIEKVTFTANIKGTHALKTVYSPSDDITVTRNGNQEAVVTFEERSVRRDRDFRLALSMDDQDVGFSVLSYRPVANEDGYFLVLATPEIRQRNEEVLAKNVVFVLDRSGSMAGKKLEQALDALRFVLDNLRENDRFNIVAYDDEVETYKPEMQRYSSSARREATAYVNNIRSGGSTNIEEALAKALALIPDDGMPSYVLFLTDGLPTAGETNEMKIAQSAVAANKENARIFAFGVGNDVNARLLDRLVAGNGGVSVYVSPDEDLEAKVADLYGSLTSPVMANVSLTMNGTDVNRAYPRTLPDLFEGRQLVWVGRYTRSGNSQLQLSGKVGTRTERFSYDTKLASTGDHQFAFVEKVWALRRIGSLIDQIDLNGRSDELVDELVALSKKHGILTPYTSFLAEEDFDLNVSSDMLRSITEENLQELEAVSGSAANAQRSEKQAYMRGGRAQAAPMSVDMEGNRRSVTSIQNVEGRTFYLRNDTWIESTVGEKEESNAANVDIFSDEFFELAATQSPELNRFLSMDRTVVVNLNGRIYRIRRPAL